MKVLAGLAGVLLVAVATALSAQTIDLAPPEDFIALGTAELNNNRARIELRPQEEITAICDATMPAADRERGLFSYGCVRDGAIRQIIYLSASLSPDDFQRTLTYELAVVGGWNPNEHYDSEREAAE